MKKDECIPEKFWNYSHPSASSDTSPYPYEAPSSQPLAVLLAHHDKDRLSWLLCRYIRDNWLAKCSKRKNNLLCSRHVSSTMSEPVSWYDAKVSIPKTCILNTPQNKGKVFYCTQINYTVDGCETIAHREFRYSQLKLLHKKLQQNFQKHPDVSIAPFPARSTKVVDRQVMLEAYLRAIVASRILATSPEFVAFMMMNSTAKGVRKPSFNHLRIKTPRFSPLAYLPSFITSLVSSVETNLCKHVKLPRNPAAKVKVMDAGCDDGLASIILCRRHRGVHITAVDYLKGRALNQIETNLFAEFIHHRVEVVVGDLAVMTFAESNSFDIVVSCFKLHKLKDEAERYAVLDEMLRVLKPGGQLFILDALYVSQYALHLACNDVEGAMSKRLHFSTVPIRYLMATKPGPGLSPAPSGGASSTGGDASEDVLYVDISIEGGIRLNEVQGESDEEDDASHSETGDASRARPRGAPEEKMVYTEVWWDLNSGEWFDMVGMLRSKRCWYQLERGDNCLRWYSEAVDGKLLGTLLLQDVDSVTQSGRRIVLTTTDGKVHKMDAQVEETAVIWMGMLDESRGRTASVLAIADTVDDDGDDGDSGDDDYPGAWVFVHGYFDVALLSWVVGCHCEVVCFVSFFSSVFWLDRAIAFSPSLPHGLSIISRVEFLRDFWYVLLVKQLLYCQNPP
eukprot:m.297583 g.297583  ORF g.297583 m.297583 type:complete len:678 (-) comp20083_c0_seq8:563-2596(-)